MGNYRVYLIAAILVSVSLPAFSQPVIEELWTQVYGGSGDDRFYSVMEANDHGFIATGTTTSIGAGARDIWLLKTDSEGTEQWSRSYGGPLNEECWLITESSSHDGYLLAGSIESPDTGSDAWGIRIDEAGDTVWTLTIPSLGSGVFYSARELNDKGYIFAGWDYVPDRQSIAVRTNPDGEILWSRVYGGDGDEYFAGVTETTDGGFLFAGATSTWGNGSRDFYVMKTDANGDSLWQVTYGGIADDFCYTIEYAGDGNYLIVGAKRSYPAQDADACLIKIDGSGQVIWNRLYGGGRYEMARQVSLTQDGGFMLAGQTTTWGTGSRSIWAIKTDGEGIMEWNHTVTMPLEQWCFSGVPTSDGDYIIAASSEYNTFGVWDSYLIKLHEAPECNPQTVDLVPSELDFGVVELGEEETLFFAVFNPDTCPLTINSMSLSEGFTTDFSGQQIVAPGSNYVIAVIFSPQEPRLYSGELRIYSNAVDSPAELAVTGIGGGPVLSVNPERLEFGEVLINSSDTLTLRITNIGTSDFAISSIYAPSYFATDFDNPVTLQAGTSVPVHVSFTPDTARFYEDILVIVSNLTPPTTAVVMTGTGIPLAISETYAGAVNAFELNSVYPNPFNPSTTISFDVPSPSDVKIAVYDIMGRRVADLVNGTVNAGSHQLSWSCPDCAAGVYMVTMTSGEFQAVTKALFIK